MIDLRQVVFRALRGDETIAEIVEDRIWQRGSTPEGVPPSETPYNVYNFNESFGVAPSALRAQRQMLQVWVHDEPGDYHVIDQILARVKVALEAVAAGNPHGFLEIRHIQNGPDLWDDLVKHIVRYSRLQATLTE
jgi:hypothetical protein